MRGLTFATGVFFFFPTVLHCCFWCVLTAAFAHCLRAAALGEPPSVARARRIANQLTP